MSTIYGDREWVCDICGAILWVNVAPDGQFYLMRIGEHEIDECRICKNNTEAVQ